MSQPKKEKTTTFEGYMSGDHECFCLSKVPFKEWTKIRIERSKKREYPYPDPLLMYPSEFFPEQSKKGKWKFTITVQAEKLDGV